MASAVEMRGPTTGVEAPAAIVAQQQQERPLDLAVMGGRLTIALAAGAADGSAPGESGGDAQVKGPRKISGTAYAGSAIQSWYGSFIIDIAGIKLPEAGRTKPLLLNHGKPWLLSQNEDRRVGFVEEFTREPGALKIAGKMLSNETAKRIVADADEGYPFELSVQIDQIQRRMLRAGESARINGREVVGPIEVIDSCLLREVSVVELGADPETNTAMLRARLLGAIGVHHRDTEFAEEGRGSGARPETPNHTPETPAMATPESTALSATPAPGASSAGAPASGAAAPTPGGNAAAVAVPGTAALAATPAELKTLPGADAAWCFGAIERGLTLSAAKDELLASLAARAQNSAPSAHSQPATGGGGSVQPALALGAPAAGAGAGGSAGTLTHNGQTFKVLGGALGRDPHEDWKNSEELRTHWKDNKSGFLMFAGAQQRAGEPFNVEV